MYEDVKTLSASAAGYRDVLNNIEEINESRERLVANYNSISKAEIERLGKVLPANVDTVRLALDLDSIAAKYGISIQDVKIDQNQNTATQVSLPGHGLPYEKTPVRVSFVSTYENFKKFLDDLEKSLRIMDIKEVTFLVTDNGLYEHTILLDTYWVK